MVDAGFVGRTLDPAPPYRVSAAKIAEFARAGAGDAEVCRAPVAARAAGHPEVVAPPTFTVTFTMPLIEAFLRDPAFGWDYSRMVHGDQSITLHRPIHGGDELVTVVHIEELQSRAGAHRLTLRCEVVDVEGAAV